MYTVPYVYGTVCAPFLANACMLELADQEAATFPLGAEIIRKNRYADDFFAGADTMPMLMKKSEQLINILKSGGMTVGKWSSNQQELIVSLGVENLQVKEQLTSNNEVVSTLGLLWVPAKDYFCFRITGLDS